MKYKATLWNLLKPFLPRMNKTLVLKLNEINVKFDPKICQSLG